MFFFTSSGVESGSRSRFNIMHTGPDLNFDRIAHLAKLVFNTKGVVLSVVDGEEEWFKSECALFVEMRGIHADCFFLLFFAGGSSKVHSCPRSSSFSGHAILQRDEEPMVVLDSHFDWRFANNVSFHHSRLMDRPPTDSRSHSSLGHRTSASMQAHRCARTMGSTLGAWPLSMTHRARTLHHGSGTR